MVEIKIKVDKFMKVSLEIPQEVDLIDFLGISEKVKKLGKSIEIPMEVEKENETGIPSKVKDKIKSYHQKGISYANISIKILKKFGIGLNRQQLQEICLEMGLITKILGEQTQQTIYKKQNIPSINVTDEVKSMIMDRKSVNYSYHNISEYVKRHLNIQISKEQVRDIVLSSGR
jgi:intein-encoded DNA endonuclease-like protein